MSTRSERAALSSLTMIFSRELADFQNSFSIVSAILHWPCRSMGFRIWKMVEIWLFEALACSSFICSID
jgi:hypothetical protein